MVKTARTVWTVKMERPALMVLTELMALMARLVLMVTTEPPGLMVLPVQMVLTELMGLMAHPEPTELMELMGLMAHPEPMARARPLYKTKGSQVVATPTAINFVGDGVVVTDASGIATVTIPGGGGITTAHDLYAGWSADSNVTATEVLAGASSDTDTVTLPNATGSQYLFVWRADDDGGDPTEVHISSGGNQRNLFGTATALTVDSVPGQLIVTVTTANADFLSAENLRIV